MLINSNEVTVEVNLPDAPKGDDNNVYQLPPYNKVQCYKTDDYEGAPQSWMRSGINESSYFLPVKSGKHLWLDFNHNSRNSYHYGIVISIQGINPITNKPTSDLKMEQYKAGDKCPEPSCNHILESDLFCKGCGYKWPSKNYMATASIRKGLWWIDGFRTMEGQIRGFLITEEEMRGIASQLIGDKRTFSIGVAFFRTKKAKEKPIKTSSFMRTCGPCGQSASIPHDTYKDIIFKSSKSMYDPSLESSCRLNDGKPLSFNDTNTSRGLSEGHISIADLSPFSVKKMEIAGGVKISQNLDINDILTIEDYESEPTGIIYINYCDERSCEEILKTKIDKTKNGEGALANLNVGNR